MLQSNTFAISYASFREGLYLFFSRKTIVSLRTLTFFARSSWVKLNLALYSLILLFIFNAGKVEHEPAYGKDNCHAHYPDTNNGVGL